jgi:hypothetical protein
MDSSLWWGPQGALCPHLCHTRQVPSVPVTPGLGWGSEGLRSSVSLVGSVQVRHAPASGPLHRLLALPDDVSAEVTPSPQAAPCTTPVPLPHAQGLTGLFPLTSLLMERPWSGWMAEWCLSFH